MQPLAGIHPKHTHVDTDTALVNSHMTVVVGKQYQQRNTESVCDTAQLYQHHHQQQQQKHKPNKHRAPCRVHADVCCRGQVDVRCGLACLDGGVITTHNAIDEAEQGVVAHSLQLDVVLLAGQGNTDRET